MEGIVIYYPRVTEMPWAMTRKKNGSKIHYVATEEAAATLCGVSTKDMSQRCLDEMSLEEARAQVDSCRRCISAMV